MALLVVVLAYTTIIGAFSYAQVCLDYLTDRPWVSRALQIGAVVCAGVGSVQQLTTVWTLADVLLGVGAIINLIALVALSRWVACALRDWERSNAIRGRTGVGRPSALIPTTCPQLCPRAPGRSRSPRRPTASPDRNTVSVAFENRVHHLSPKRGG